MKRFITLFALLLFATQIRAANNPLNIIDATKSDDRSPDIRVDTSSEGEKFLNTIHEGDFAVYKGYDFDSGVAAFQMYYSSGSRGTVEVRLDSLTGPLMGIVHFSTTGGSQNWSNIGCNVDNTQATVRDIYLIFHGENKGSVVKVSHFSFLKSVVIPGAQSIDLSGRLDVEDNEPQGKKAWGMPETGFRDDFSDGTGANWTLHGLAVKDHALTHEGTDLGLAYTPSVYINKTDTGGEWRSIAEASLAADVVAEAPESRPGLGFISRDGAQYIDVILNPAADTVEVYRQLRDGPPVQITLAPKPSTDPDKQLREAANAKPRTWHIQTGVTYHIQLDWSPYSNGLILFLSDDKGTPLTNFRTVIDLPAARRPLLLASGGAAHFGNVVFDPTLDSWNLKWEWKKTPVLTPDVCNPALWKGKDGKFYMMWRNFGADNFHGVASSVDGLNWTPVTDHAIKCTGDMNVVVDPFGDGQLYITSGGNKSPWWTCDGTDCGTWTQTTKNLGYIYTACRIQAIIDTARYPQQLAPIDYNGQKYRFIAFCEDWGKFPRPLTLVFLSNTLTDWVQTALTPLVPPGDDFWGERGNAIGAAVPLPDGNIMVGSCSCTNAGYTGAPEPSNVSVIVDGKQPWKVLKKAILPDAPVSREAIWYQGPNFGTDYLYDDKTDTLYYYGGFHDYSIGVLRVRHFKHPEAN